MEISGQLHVQAALAQKNRIKYLQGGGEMEDHRDSLNCFEKGKSIALAGKRNPFSQLPIS